MPRLTLAVLLILMSMACQAQKEAAVWYFGRNAGLDFNSGAPIAITDGQINTTEGVASICDTNGNLLFYTEGTKVWNRQHQVMPNGTGLLGSYSSSQSAIIVPKINDPGRYYIFTVAQLGGPDGLNYSIVNMALAGGMGDIEVKNVPMATPLCEKLTAVKHCNGIDIWVIVHKLNSADILSYLVTPAGVSNVPVISAPGLVITTANLRHSIGCMKVSPDGRKLALAHNDLGVEVFDFNNNTGVASGGGSLFLPSEYYGLNTGSYGVEFSPNGRFLYVGGDYYDPDNDWDLSYLLQYDVSSTDMNVIRSSKYSLYSNWPHHNGENFGSLQVGPDGKIYLAESDYAHLSIINNPNKPGAASNFVHNAIYLRNSSTYGLPSFIQSFFRPTFTFRGACAGTFIYFDYERALSEYSIKWDFGDPASGANNTSTLDSSQHQFTTEGIYTVKLIRFTNCGSDTISKTVQVGSNQVNLGPDTIICGATPYQIIPQTVGNNNYTWQDGSTNNTFAATQTGLFWVEAINNVNGCKKRDSVNVTFKPSPSFSLGNDQLRCERDVVDLSVNVPTATYLWNNGSTNNSMQVTQPGNYWLEVSLNGCKNRDTVAIVFNSYPIVNLGPDAVVCEGSNLQLDAGNPGMNYQWQDNSTTQTLSINDQGTYWVIVDNQGCISKDTILVELMQKPFFMLGKDTSICQGMTIELSPTIQRGENLSYVWNTGSTDKSISITRDGVYSLLVSNQCGNQSEDVVVKKGLCKMYVPSAFTPNGDGLNDYFKASYGENITDFNLQVYNRWGEIVFASKDMRKGWNGQYKGRLQDSGVFVWMIRYRTLNDTKDQLLRGTVMLIR